MGKKKFVTWVYSHKKHHSEKEKYNFVSLRGGKFNISDSDTFFKLFCRDYVKLSQTNAFPLVFRGPREKLTPFYLDVDLELEEDVSIPTGVFIEMTHQFLLILKEVLQTNEVWKVIISRRTGSYWKDNLRCFKNGFHVLIPNLRVTPDVMTRFRTALLADGYWYTLLREFKIRNKPESVIDVAITARRNGLLLLGLNKLLEKKNGPCSAHYVCYFDTWRSIWFGDTEPRSFGWQFENKTKNEDYKEILKMAYGWVFGHDYSKTEVPAPVSAPISPVSPVSTEGTFNLPYFLQLLGNNTLPHTEWKQLVAFCKGHGLNKTETCKLLNDHCSPKDLHENERMFEHAEATGPCLVGKGSIVRMLRSFQVDFDNSKLFPGEIYKYHNQSEMFLTERKVWTYEEIYAYFNSVYGYTFGEGKTTFLYRERRDKWFGKVLRKIIVFVATKHMPFGDASSDIEIECEPALKSWRGALKKIIKKKYSSYEEEVRTKRAQQLLTSENHNDLKEFLTAEEMPLPEKRGLGLLFLKAKKTGHIKKRFHGFTFIPYLTPDKNNCTPDTYNIFKGFEMQQFRNTEVDLKATKVWRWIWEAICDKNEYKLKFFLTYLAVKLQQPHRKVNKFLILFARITGCGKTSIAKFLTKLFGQDYVLMVQSISEFLSENNCFLLGKLFVIIDDIEKATKTVSDSLKSRISEPTFTMKKLYEDRKTMATYADLITTSNSRTPVFIDSNDRRSELIAINTCLEPLGTTFWNGFYKELEDPHIMGAFFEFLATFPIELDVRSKKNRFDVGQLNTQKLKSMRTTHRWLVNFFQEESCFESTYTKNYVGDYLRPVGFTLTDKQRFCNLSVDRAFSYLQHWSREQGCKLSISMKTFLEDLKDVGIEKQRLQISKQGDKKPFRGWGIKLCEPFVRKSMMKHLQVEKLNFKWCFNDPESFSILKENYYKSDLLYKVPHRQSGFC